MLITYGVFLVLQDKQRVELDWLTSYSSVLAKILVNYINQCNQILVIL